MRLLKNFLFIFLVASVFGFSTVEPKAVGLPTPPTYLEYNELEELKGAYSALEMEVKEVAACTDSIVKNTPSLNSKYAKK